MFIVTKRDDVAVPCRKFDEVVEQIRRNDVSITSLKLMNLSDDKVNHVLSQVMSLPCHQVEPLTKIIYSQTEGNLFFVLEMLRSLQNEGLIQYNFRQGCWFWLDHDIQLTFQQTSVCELITDRIFQLPKESHNLLKVAACLGSKLNVEILSHTLSTPVETHLAMAAESGLLTMNGSTYSYEFAHDGIREATYDLIPSDQRASFHLYVGRALKALDPQQLDTYIFVVLGQLEKGSQLIFDRTERIEVAGLCFRGGAQAVLSSSFNTASTYFLFGIRLLDEACWSKEYKMCLELHNCATEVEYCNGHFASLDSLAETVIAKARSFRDTLRVRTCLVYSLGGRNRITDALRTGLEVLNKLGETFPKNPTRFDWYSAFSKTWGSIKKRTPEAILRLPLMQNQDKLAAMQMLNLMFSFAYTNMPFLAPLIACRMVDLTLDHGICTISSPCMVMFSSLLIRWGQRVDEGCRYGKLAFDIYEKFGEKAWWGRLCAGYYSCVSAWTHPIKDDLEGLKAAHRIALETGDIEIAMVNANLYCWFGFGILSLVTLEKEIRNFVDSMELRGQQSNLFMILPLWQMCQNFLGMAVGDPKVLTGNIIDQKQYLKQAEEKNPHSALWLHFDLCFLAYLFGDYEAAQYHASRSHILVRFPFCSFTIVSVIMFESLVALALYRKDRKHRFRRICLARKAIKALAQWSQQTPINFLGQLHLLKAELAAALGDYINAVSSFTCAIALTSKGGFVMLEALANERAGRFFLQMGNQPLASSHFQEACQLYIKWGGYAKAGHLKSEIESAMASLG